jgi:hypothetical protein
MFVHRRDVQIQWGDCDPANIVYYPRYFAMFDDSTSRGVRNPRPGGARPQRSEPAEIGADARRNHRKIHGWLTQRLTSPKEGLNCRSKFDLH